MDRWSREWLEKDRHRDTARGREKERTAIEKNRRTGRNRQIRRQTLREKESGRPRNTDEQKEAEGG